MNVLYCTSEAAPFVMSGGLGDVAGSLPKAIKNRRVNCRVVLPLYGDIKQEYRDKMKYLTNFYVPVGWRSQYCGVFELRYNGLVYYFLDNEYYFKRNGLYGYYDDGERFAFFSRAILEMLKNIDFAPDIIHTNDWQTALVNVYINLFYRSEPKFYAIKTLFTIHNIQYQGKYGMDIVQDTLGIDKKDEHILEYGGCVNLMKAAIECADKVNTVSPTYSREILDPWFSHGLDKMLSARIYKLSGIVNGIDVKAYDPETDPVIAKNYNAQTFVEGKKACKAALREKFNLAETDEPIIAMVTRLVSHKGLDLVRHVAEYIIDSGMQMVVLGSGDWEYENFFNELASKFPGRFGTYIGFVPSLAHQIYAGADMFLMPSKSEPCGLSQMVALRYGAVPIVRETGGLKDTVTDSGDNMGNGFTFKSYNAHDMLDACLRAKEGFANAKGWQTLVKRDMQIDNSWGSSAKAYIALYNEMLTLWE